MKLAVLAIHGVGETRAGYSEALFAQLRLELGAAAREVCFLEIDYQKHLQSNQAALWARLRGGLRWLFVRRFLLFYFGDAAAVLYNSADPGSVYIRVQETVREVAAQALAQLADPGAPVVIIAQSLGGQVISSYLWDAARGQGVWAQGGAGAQEAFLKLRTTRYLLTTGCNIPLIVSGLPQAVPFDRPEARFRWLNFYDPDDPLGWPLAPLYRYGAASARPEDCAVNVGGLLTHWNPLSHGGYWSSPSFIRPAAQLIRELLASLP